MEQTNYQELDKKLFSEYIADPSAIGSGDSQALEKSLEKFPYCQLLHSFYARSVSDTDPESFERQLSRTALISPNRMVLYKIIKEAEKLKGTGIDTQSDEEQSPETFSEIEEEIPVSEQIDNDLTISTDEDFIETLAVAEDPSLDEGQQDLPEVESDTEPVSEEVQPEPQSDVSLEVPETEFEADQIGAFKDIETSENIEAPVPASASGTDDQKVSKYDDDKLPYSFLWWLSKTRKEHSDTYQPYVNFKLDTSQSIRRNSVDQLSSQIIENIFHLQSPVAELENAPRTVPFQVKRKEDYILEKFIRDEPQIKAPDSQKLDTENKARKSAEDPNDLVSETLAQIYTDQMLFHKAIDTYKKLSLKFPEKSTYFADQIRELEKKVN